MSISKTPEIIQQNGAGTLTINIPNQPLAILSLEDGKQGGLFCVGCAHSDAAKPFPGQPSGERPCGFCSRNSDVQRAIAKGLQPGTDAFSLEIGYASAYRPSWYAHTRPIKLPMDCYHTLDMKYQFTEWLNQMEITAKAKGYEEGMEDGLKRMVPNAGAVK